MYTLGDGDNKCNSKSVICSQCSSLNNENSENTTTRIKVEGTTREKNDSSFSTKSSQTLFSNILDLNQNIIDIDQKRTSDKSATSKRLLQYYSKNPAKKNRWQTTTDKFRINKSVQFGNIAYSNHLTIFILNYINKVR